MLRKAALSLGEITYLTVERSHNNISKALAKASKPYTMFARENDLPQLPVPPLHQTLEKYLVSLVPLLTKEEFRRAEDCVKEFGKPGGVGEELQAKLLARASKTDNWIAEWWDDVAYFKFKEPVVVHSSPGIGFPHQTFATQTDQLRYAAKTFPWTMVGIIQMKDKDRPALGLTNWYAARLIRNALSFKALIDSRSLPVDMQGKDPMTMVQYKKLLSTCRIPNKGGDYAIVTPKEDSRHIIVVHNNHFFTLDVYLHGTNKRLSEKELIHQLEQIVKGSPEPDPNPLGVLTASDRLTWASNWKKLRKDRINRFGLDLILKSIFLLCLDQPCQQPTYSPAKGEDQLYSITCAQSLHGGGVDLNSCNRYFDRIIQFFVSRDGHNGCCYEHSTAEGPPVLKLCNYVLQNRDMSIKDDLPVYLDLEPPKKIKWNINPALQDQIEFAMDHIDALSGATEAWTTSSLTKKRLVDDLEVRFFKYRGYGKSVPKKHKISPDAWLQMAFQLAYFRLHGHSPSTYETASTKKFKRGRTETIRTASIASDAFCRAMDSSNTTLDSKRDLFRKATIDHTKHTMEAMNGQGIDRHLLGLKIAAVESNIPLPELFRDKGYIYSMQHELSTSQVPSPFDTVLCFGPTSPDGYGLCYNPREKDINLGITAFNSNPSTNAGLFGEAVIKCLSDLELLMTTSHL